MTEGGNFPSVSNYTDADFKRTIWSALRLMAVVTAVAVTVEAYSDPLAPYPAAA